jgi:hypothetical protein
MRAHTCRPDELQARSCEGGIRGWVQGWVIRVDRQPAFESMLVRDGLASEYLGLKAPRLIMRSTSYNHAPFVNSFVARPLRQKFSFVDREIPGHRAICGRNGDMVSGGRAGGRAACTRIAYVHH